MGMTNLDAFGGEANVLGAVKSIRFEGGDLTFKGLTLAEAYAIIEAVGTGGIRSVQLPVAPMAHAVPPDAPHAEKEPVGLALVPGATSFPPEAAKVADAAQRLGASEAPQPVTGFVPIETPKSEIPQEIRDTKRLLSVVEWVQREKKAKTIDEIVACLETLRDELPLVKVIRDLRERVSRVLEQSA